MVVSGVRSSWTGVGDEAAQPVLRGGTFGEGGLDLAQHGVERQAQPTDLGVGIGGLHPAGEVAAGDVAGRGGDAFQRQQPEPHHRQRQQGQEQEDGRGGHHLDAHQPPQGLVELGGREGHEQRRTVGRRGGQDAPAKVAVADGADGGELVVVARRLGQVGFGSTRLRRTAPLRRWGGGVRRTCRSGMTDRPDGRRRENPWPRASSLRTGSRLALSWESRRLRRWSDSAL